MKIILKKSLLLLALCSLLVATTGFSCTLFQPRVDPKFDPRKPVTLRYWRVFDDTDTMDPLVEAYRKLHPNVTIEYRKLRYDEYEQALLEAQAVDRGPDIFSIQNNWVDAYQERLLPLPKTITMGSLVTKGSIKKTTTTEVKTIDTSKDFSPMKIRQTFVDTVGEDVLRGERGSEVVYGLPFSVDVMALFYNTKLFRDKNVIAHLANWNEFEETVQKMTITDRTKNDMSDITQSGAAIGTASNVERATDIVSAIMMQFGTRMTQKDVVTFNKMPPQSPDQSVLPAAVALGFYTDFASFAPRKQVYTWNEEQPNSLEAFMRGKTAMFFGYSYHQQIIERQTPELPYTIVPLPQLDPNRPVAPANYWVEVVSKKTEHPDYAWDFIMNTAGNVETMKKYLTKSGHPTALRALVEEQQKDEDLSAFAQQLLMAQNWYHGRKPAEAEKIMKTMITEALNAKAGNSDIERQKLTTILTKAQQAIQEGY